jgi:uncharacterized membrane protein (GlpM family)
MFSLALTILVLIVVYFLQEHYPFLAGILAVAPVKVVATSFIVYEDGGVSSLLEAITGMMVAQFVVAGGLFVFWLALKYGAHVY